LNFERVLPVIKLSPRSTRVDASVLMLPDSAEKRRIAKKPQKSAYPAGKDAINSLT
jgi:hypothetical protein